MRVLEPKNLCEIVQVWLFDIAFLGIMQGPAKDQLNTNAQGRENKDSMRYIVDDHAFVCVGLKATLHDEYQNIEVTTTDHGDTAL